MDIEWDLDHQGQGLSHWDVILKAGCAIEDHLIEFDTTAGYSTSENEPVNPAALWWTGFFVREGDSFLGITEPIVKYNDSYNPLDPSDEPSAAGYGVFSYYANEMRKSAANPWIKHKWKLILEKSFIKSSSYAEIRNVYESIPSVISVMYFCKTET